MPDAMIIVEGGGGYVVDGAIGVTIEDGRKLDLRYDVQPCRCGGCGTHPFCDGTQPAIDFDTAFCEPIKRAPQ